MQKMKMKAQEKEEKTEGEVIKGWKKRTIKRKETKSRRKERKRKRKREGRERGKGGGT